MTNIVFDWFLIIAVLIAPYPSAWWLLWRSKQEGGAWLVILLTLALSTGVLSLVMFWQALAGVRFTLWGITLPYMALMLPGFWLWWRGGHRLPVLPRPASKQAWLMALVLGAICGGILFNSLYWPFSRDDAMAIYARFGVSMAASRTLEELPGALTVHEAYPILVPLTYTYTYLAAGWEHEFLARLFPALLSIGCLGAAYTLGLMLRGSLAGWISTMVLALAPTFETWASSGYVDLPMAFFYTLSAIFAWRLWRVPHWSSALLTGAMVGLAAWTKNAGLIGVGIVALWLLWMLFQRRINWQHAMLAWLACAVVAAPWYIRNIIEANLIIPDTAWTDQASQTLETLFIFITHPEIYSLSGVLILAGIASALIAVIRRRLNAPELLLPLWWILPFFGAWWLFASYDPRFVLLFLPLMCTVAGIELSKLWGWLPAGWRRWLRLAIVIIVIILAIPAIWDSVEFKDNLLRNPLASVEERRITVYESRQPQRLTEP